MVDVYRLNGVEVYVRTDVINNEYEIRLFEDDEQGHRLRMPFGRGIGNALDAAYNEILIKLNDNRLYSIDHKRIQD